VATISDIFDVILGPYRHPNYILAAYMASGT
jgi:hypothetical protein